VRRAFLRSASLMTSPIEIVPWSAGKPC